MKKLPPNVRVLLIIVGFPFVGVLGLIFYKFYVGEGNEVSGGAIILGTIGIAMYYLAIRGSLPFTKK